MGWQGDFREPVPRRPRGVPSAPHRGGSAKTAHTFCRNKTDQKIPINSAFQRRLDSAMRMHIAATGVTKCIHEYVFMNMIHRIYNFDEYDLTVFMNIIDPHS